MAPMLSSNNIRNLTHKVLLFFIAFASVAIVTELTVPLLLNFAVNDLPVVWSTISSWVKPPYLYLLINIIILTISVTSYFHQQDDQEDQSQPLVCRTEAKFLQVPSEASFGVFDSVANGFYEETQPDIVSVEVVPVTATCHSSESSLVSTDGEKPVVDFRFAQRKRIKTSPDGAKSLNVATEVTVENDGYTNDDRHIAPTRHLQKSMTIDSHRYSDVYRSEEAEPAAGNKKKKVVRKSATLKDRTNYDDKNHRPPSQPSPGSGGKKRKDGSLSNDELNRRVEEFIKKFNDEMRQQRQESVKQYRALTNRGVSYR